MRTPERVARVLRSVRQEAGLTQAELAARAGVSREAVSLIENARRDVRVETLAAVLDALDYEVAFVARTAKEQRLRDRSRDYPAWGKPER